MERIQWKVEELQHLLNTVEILKTDEKLEKMVQTLNNYILKCMNEKKCVLCGHTKVKEDFVNNRNKCKDCYSEQNHRVYMKNKEFVTNNPLRENTIEEIVKEEMKRLEKKK